MKGFSLVLLDKFTAVCYTRKKRGVKGYVAADTGGAMRFIYGAFGRQRLCADSHARGCHHLAGAGGAAGRGAPWR